MGGVKRTSTIRFRIAYVRKPHWIGCCMLNGGAFGGRRYTEHRTNVCRFAAPTAMGLALVATIGRNYLESGSPFRVRWILLSDWFRRVPVSLSGVRTAIHPGTGATGGSATASRSPQPQACASADPSRGRSNRQQAAPRSNVAAVVERRRREANETARVRARRMLNFGDARLATGDYHSGAAALQECGAGRFGSSGRLLSPGTGIRSAWDCSIESCRRQCARASNGNRIGQKRIYSLTEAYGEDLDALDRAPRRHHGCTG